MCIGGTEAETSFVPEVGNAFLWDIPLGRKVGVCVILRKNEFLVS